MKLDEITGREYRALCADCPFTEEEEEILALARRGVSLPGIAMHVHLSERTVSRRLASIRNKIARELA